MPSTEFNSEEIGLSVAQIGEVYRYAKGELVLPLQDPLLEQKYTDAITRYFEYCSRALTDPDIGRLMKKGRVGLWYRNSPPYSHSYTYAASAHMAKYIDGVHMVAPGPYKNTSISLLVDEPSRLVLTVERYLDHINGHAEGYLEAQQSEWRKEVSEEYISADGYNDWEFNEKGDHDSWGTQGIYLFGYRSLEVGDLLYSSGSLPRFVEGVKQVFHALKRSSC